MPSIPFASISKVECAFSRLLKGIIFEVEMTASPILCLPSCLRGGGLGSKFYFSIIWVDLNFRDLPSRTFYRIHCCWYIMSIFFIFPEAWFWSNSLKLHRFGAQPPLPQISYKMKWKTSKFCFIQIFCYAFFFTLQKMTIFGCSNEKLFNNFSVLGHTKWIPCFASFQFWKVVRACGFEFYLLFFSV